MDLTSTALVATDRPGRYAKQLAAHLARRSETTWDEASGTGVIAFPQGGRAELAAVETGLALRLFCAPEDVARLEDVVGRHLVRFGARDELVVAWCRVDGTAGTVQRFGGEDA